MTTIGPLIGTFGFFTILFVVGKFFQKREREDRKRRAEALVLSMNLFQLGTFNLHSGETSAFKIDCDALTDGDLDCIAYLLAAKLPFFGPVEGIPSGGLRLAEKMRKYSLNSVHTLLIVDDVLTTGGSLEKHRNGRDAIGAVIFSRGAELDWVVPLFKMVER